MGLQLATAVGKITSQRIVDSEKQCAGWQKERLHCRSMPYEVERKAVREYSQRKHRFEWVRWGDLSAVLHQVQVQRTITITVSANQPDLVMEVDTGASVSLMNEATYKQTWENNVRHRDKTNIKLRTYFRECLKVLGALKVDVVYKDQNEWLPIIVVAGDGWPRFVSTGTN